MVNVDDSWQYCISGLTAQVWGLAATWCSVCIHQMNQVNSCNGFGHDVHVINIIKALLGHIACTECRDAACTVDTDVPWCVCLSVDISLSCAKTDKPIEMLFGIWTRWPQGTMYLYEVEAQIPLGKGKFLGCSLSSKICDHLYLSLWLLLILFFASSFFNCTLLQCFEGWLHCCAAVAVFADSSTCKTCCTNHRIVPKNWSRS